MISRGHPRPSSGEYQDRTPKAQWSRWLKREASLNVEVIVGIAVTSPEPLLRLLDRPPEALKPGPLPFAKAEASRDGKTIKIFLELRAGGYAGSTYTLTYDPVADRLAGIYFQAVAQQRFNIYFVRAK